MSATIMVDLFSHYYSVYNIKNVENIDYYKSNMKDNEKNYGNAPIIKITNEIFQKIYIY